MRAPYERLLVCYVPALDLRRIDPERFPHLSGQLASRPWVSLRTFPTTEHVPTMLTGAYPHQTGCWGPRLVGADGSRSRLERLVDGLPTFVSTGVQGLRHLAWGPYDLATMPPRRRRRFEWVRFKYVKHARVEQVVLPINGLETVFTAVGSDRSRYVYEDDFRRLDLLLARLPDPRRTLEIVEVHCLDRLQHWRLDHEADLTRYFRGVDAFLAELERACRARGVGLLLLSDHGMEPVRGWIDIGAVFAESGAREDGYDYFIENTKATLWFHEDDARSRITERLRACPDTTSLPREEMTRFALHLDDRALGDHLVYPQPGFSFYPNDFHQPFASIALSLLDWQERPRLWDPRHRGDHGYLPGSPSEEGFMLLPDDGYEAASGTATLLDVAPSILALLGRAAPATMRGRARFRARA